MKDNNYATCYYSHYYGPRFGKSEEPDLTILDKSNSSFHIFSNNNIFTTMNFEHKNYGKNIESYKRFTGY
jgi:hypothetical protein